MVKKIITIYQRPPMSYPEEGSKEYRFILNAAKKSSVFIFPEYSGIDSYSEDLNLIKSQSEKNLIQLVNMTLLNEFKDTLLVGGTIVYEKNGKMYNAAPIIFNGKIQSYYLKKVLFEKEKKFLTSGNSNLVITHPVSGKKIGVLICADVLDMENFRSYNEVDYIAIPVASPFKENDTVQAQNERDRIIFLNGAKESNATVFKCCLAAPENDSDHSFGHKIQGRSLIAAPDGIKITVPHIKWQGLILFSETDHSTTLQEYT